MTEEQQTVESETTSTELVVPESMPLVANAETKQIVMRRAGLPPIFWALLGVGIGVAGTLAVVSNRPAPKKFVAQVPAPASGPTPGGGMTNTQNSNPLGSNPLSLASPGQAGANMTDAPEAPMNPFGGSSFVLPKISPKGAGPGPSNTPGLSGMILPKNLPTLPPAAPSFMGSASGSSGPGATNAATNTAGNASGVTKLLPKGIPVAPPALKAPSVFSKPTATPSKASDAKAGDRSTLVTVNQAASDRQGAADDVIDYATKLGGKGQPLTEQGSDGKPEVKGVLATVPSTAVDDLLKHLAATGSVVEKQTWSGSSDERKSKLVEDGQARIASLKKLREALLVTYLEDAQPVKEVDEEIAKATKSLDQLQTDKGAEKMTIVRVMFVNKG